MGHEEEADGKNNPAIPKTFIISPGERHMSCQEEAWLVGHATGITILFKPKSYTPFLVLLGIGVLDNCKLIAMLGSFVFFL